jgi:hypothetical protein
MLPKYWINRFGEKIKISTMPDAYIDAVICDLEELMGDDGIQRPIYTYASMFNKGKKWAVRTAKRWSSARLKAMKLEKANRLSACTYPQ